MCVGHSVRIESSTFHRDAGTNKRSGGSLEAVCVPEDVSLRVQKLRKVQARIEGVIHRTRLKLELYTLSIRSLG